MGVRRASYNINGHIVTGSKKEICEKLASGEFDFYNPVCICGKRCSAQQIFHMIGHKTINQNTSRYLCEKHNPLSQKGKTRKKVTSIYIEGQGVPIWVAPKPLSREETFKALENVKLYSCPLCGGDISHYQLLYHWTYVDSGNDRKIVIPQDYTCCVNGRVQTTRIIFHGEAHDYTLEKERLLPLINYVTCRRCGNPVTNIKRLVGAHNSNLWELSNTKLKVVNFDTCAEQYCLCDKCYENYLKTKKAELGRTNGCSVSNFVRNEAIKSVFNKERCLIQPSESFQQERILMNELLGYNVDLYFDFASIFPISSKGIHHLLPRSEFQRDDLIVDCTVEDHFILHYLLALSILIQSPEPESLSELRLIQGLRIMINTYPTKYKPLITDTSIFTRINQAFIVPESILPKST